LDRVLNSSASLLRSATVLLAAKFGMQEYLVCCQTNSSGFNSGAYAGKRSVAISG
jgi:hypothetical protein